MPNPIPFAEVHQARTASGPGAALAHPVGVCATDGSEFLDFNAPQSVNANPSITPGEQALKRTSSSKRLATNEGHKAFEVAEQIKALSGMDMPTLWALWDSFFAHRPSRPNRVHLESRLTYKLQEQAFGEMPTATREMLADYGARFSKIKTPSFNPRAVLPGTKLKRDFDGRQYTVTVQADGFYEYEGKSYKSLSAIAKQITGTQWSGPAFFGMRGKA